MKKYEAIFILDIRKVEDEGKGFTEEFGKNLESWGGKLIEANAMGRKQFAREINKRKAGIYWDYVFEMDPLKVIEVRNQYRLDERLIRLLVINYDRKASRPSPAQRSPTDKTIHSEENRRWHLSTRYFLWAI